MPDDKLAEIEARWANAVSVTYDFGTRCHTGREVDAENDIGWLIEEVMRLRDIAELHNTISELGLMTVSILADELKRLRKHEPPKSKEADT